MFTVKIAVEPVVAEYIRGKFIDREVGVVRFPSSHDIYHTIYNLTSKRPESCPVDFGNLEIAIPDRRSGDEAGGKDPNIYNYISARGAAILNRRFKILMWAELHEAMDENKHLHGVQFKDTAYEFIHAYGLTTISEDALLKNYQRWRDRIRRRSKRRYKFKKSE